MIALLSAQIEAGARAFATLLVNLLPASSTNQKRDTLWG